MRYLSIHRVQSLAICEWCGGGAEFVERSTRNLTAAQRDHLTVFHLAADGLGTQENKSQNYKNFQKLLLNIFKVLVKVEVECILKILFFQTQAKNNIYS